METKTCNKCKEEYKPYSKADDDLCPKCWLEQVRLNRGKKEVK